MEGTAAVTSGLPGAGLGLRELLQDGRAHAHPELLRRGPGRDLERRRLAWVSSRGGSDWSQAQVLEAAAQTD